MMQRGFKYVYSDAKRAHRHLDSALSLSRQKGFVKGTYKVLNIYGIIHDVAGRHDSAIHLYHFARKLAILNRDSISFAQINNNIGLIYWNQNKLDSALELYRSSEQCFRKFNQKPELANALNNIGLIMSDAKRQNEARSIFREVLILRYALNDTFGIGAALHNLGYTWFGANPDSALRYYKAALPFKRAVSDYAGLSKTFNDMAALSEFLPMPLHYRAAFDSAIHYKMLTGDNYGLASTYLNAGTYYSKKAGDPEMALKYLTRADSLVTAIDYPKISHKVWYELSVVKHQTGHHSDAFEYMKKSADAFYKLRNEASDKRFEELSIRYESERKEREIERLQNEQQILLLKDRQQKLLLGAVSVLMVLLSLLAWSGFKRYGQKQKLKLRDTLIAERERSLQAVIQSAEAERARLASEIHDGAVQEVAALKLNWQFEVLQGNSTNFPGEALDQLAKRLRAISHRIMPNDLKGSGFLSALQQLFQMAQGKAGILIRFEFGDLPASLPDEIQLNLYRICQELLRNAIKHSGANTLDVQLYYNGGNIVLVFEDNGKGMQVYTPKGLGLESLKARVIQSCGKIDFSESPGGGLLVTVRIPFK